MRADAIRQLVSAVGVTAWGVLLVFAGRGSRLWLVNLRWEGKQPQLKEFAKKATVAVGIGAILLGVYLGITAFV